MIVDETFSDIIRKIDRELDRGQTLDPTQAYFDNLNQSIHHLQTRIDRTNRFSDNEMRLTGTLTQINESMMQSSVKPRDSSLIGKVSSTIVTDNPIVYGQQTISSAAKEDRMFNQDLVVGDEPVITRSSRERNHQATVKSLSKQLQAIT